MMISYEILGKVTARQGGQPLAMRPLQQLLLARLLCAKGAAVTQRQLADALWGKGTRYEDRLKSAIYDLRKALATENIVIHSGDAYQLTLDSQQVDAFRFAAKVEQASRIVGAQAPQLTQAALAEWPRASGLFGGYPLQGLEGDWARGMRKKLRAQYRDVVIGSLRREADAEDWEPLLRHCGELAAQEPEDADRKDPQDALADLGFIELWLRAAYRSGQPGLAEQVLGQAAETRPPASERVAAELTRLARRIADEATHPAAAPARPARAARTSNRRTVSEPAINFNNQSGSVVNGQIGIVHGDVTIGAEPGASVQVSPEADGEAESGDEEIDE
jgi:DNA-binding SARP family transcriptional activator